MLLLTYMSRVCLQRDGPEIKSFPPIFGLDSDRLLWTNIFSFPWNSVVPLLGQEKRVRAVLRRVMVSGR